MSVISLLSNVLNAAKTFEKIAVQADTRCDDVQSAGELIWQTNNLPSFSKNEAECALLPSRILIMN